MIQISQKANKITNTLYTLTINEQVFYLSVDDVDSLTRQLIDFNKSIIVEELEDELEMLLDEN